MYFDNDYIKQVKLILEDKVLEPCSHVSRCSLCIVSKYIKGEYFCTTDRKNKIAKNYLKKVRKEKLKRIIN